MVSNGLGFSVLLQSFSVSSQSIVLQLEGLRAVSHGLVRELRCGLESLVGLERGLEVHDVLGGVTEIFLHNR